MEPFNRVTIQKHNRRHGNWRPPHLLPMDKDKLSGEHEKALYILRRAEGICPVGKIIFDWRFAFGNPPPPDRLYKIMQDLVKEGMVEMTQQNPHSEGFSIPKVKSKAPDDLPMSELGKMMSTKTARPRTSLNVEGFSVLEILMGGPLPQAVVCSKLGRSNPTITRLMNELQDLGLATRETVRKPWFLTQKGKSVYVKAKEAKETNSLCDIMMMASNLNKVAVEREEDPQPDDLDSQIEITISSRGKMVIESGGSQMELSSEKSLQLIKFCKAIDPLSFPKYED